MRVSENIILNLSGNIISDQTSESYPLEHLIGFSVQNTYQSNSNFLGRLIIQISDDEENWSDLVSKTIEYLGCSVTFNVREIFSKFMRIKLAIDAGTLTNLTSKVYAKGW